jgi:hypothetical protein
MPKRLTRQKDNARKMIGTSTLREGGEQQLLFQPVS